MEVVKKFLAFNWMKIFFWFVLVYMVFCVYYYIILPANTARNPIPILVVYYILYVFRTILRGTTHFHVMDKLGNDSTSSTSITPLFDNGYTIELADKNSPFSFTKQCLKGSVSGGPVVVSFRQGGRGRYPRLSFSFMLQVKDGSESNTNEIIGFNMTSFVGGLSIWPYLKKDIKPEVLRFAESLKEQGYTAAQQ